MPVLSSIFTHESICTICGVFVRKDYQKLHASWHNSIVETVQED